MANEPVGTGSPTLNVPPGFNNTTLREFMTFDEIYTWLNREQLGASSKPHAELPGDRWIGWIERKGKAGNVNLSATAYDHILAWQWLDAWAVTESGKGIGDAIKTALGSTGTAITKQILPGFAAGIKKTPGLQGLSTGANAVGSAVSPSSIFGGIAGALQSRSFWVRAAEVVIGGAMIIIFVAKAGSGPASRAAAKVGKATHIL